MPRKKQLWSYISRLEKVIKEIMESSPEIAELVEKIQAEGVDVSLNCIALFSDPSGRTFTSPAGKIVKGAGGPGRRASSVSSASSPQQPPKASRKKPAGSRKKGDPKPAPEPQLTLSDKDREFLRSIGIRFD